MDKSQYLDRLIKQWRDESEEQFTSKEKYIKSEVEGFKKSWDTKKLIDRVVGPMICFYFFINIFFGKTGSEMLVRTLPFIAITVLCWLQVRNNNRAGNIDLTLGVSEYRTKRMQMLANEVRFLKMARFILYPLFAIYYLYEIFFVFDYSSLLVVLSLLFTLMAAGAMAVIMEFGINDIESQVRNLE